MFVKLFLLIVTACFSLFLLSKGEDLIKKLFMNYLKNVKDVESRTLNPSNVNRTELKL